MAKRKPPMKTISLNHGGKNIQIPVLSAPVGRPSPALNLRYPAMNQQVDVDIVDYYLSQLEAFKMYSGRGAVSEMGMARLLGAVGAVTSWDDRNAAIASLQASFTVTDADEVKNCYLKPNGETLRELVDNGDVVERLMAGGASGPRQYIYTGTFNRDLFKAAYQREFAKNGHYSIASMPAMFEFVRMMEEDPAMMDIRWMAYMLGTALIESSHFVKVPAKPKSKRVVMNFSPVEETGHGKGRDYYLPVKVKRLHDGTARVTEQDGDQFLVTAGTADPVSLTKGAKRGVSAGTVASSTYVKDDGTPLAYYGRGFVQLTWWSNYATAGSLLGRGLDFLFNPELVQAPATAYQIMSYCMRTGKGFANKRAFPRYFCGPFTDYLGARDMVNARGDHKEVADAARLFEKVLFESRRTPTLLAVQ